MLDCGCHPGREGADGLPFFDSLDSLDGISAEDIDLILITHFHIDHCAALPYFTEKTNFKGRIFMTHATKAVMKLLLSDNIKLQFKQNPLYSEQDLQNCIDKVEVVDFHQTVEHHGIKFTATAAGHVLGAAMFMIDIDGVRVLYTGDYSLENDRHLVHAEVPAGGPPDVLIVESTFGTDNIPPREKRELDFTKTVESIVRRGGSCLIPVFALGRAQELLLILDEYWQRHQDLQSVPIFYASKLASKSLRVYQTFINMMNDHIRASMDQFQNPFKLQHIRSLTNQTDDFDVFGPSVVMASPGFLQSGVSRQLFESWCDSEKNGVVIAGYTIEGTLAHDLLSNPSEIKCLDNKIKPRRCQIENISFSAHVDYTQNKSFIRSVMPDYIILVHGERSQMRKLKGGLEAEMKKSWSTSHRPSIATPENGVKVKLRFRKNIVADVLGSVAEAITQSVAAVDSGSSLQLSRESVGVLPARTLLITENFTSKVVAASEIAQHSSFRFCNIWQRIVVPIPKGFSIPVSSLETKTMSAVDWEVKLLSLAASYLEEVFDNVQVLLSGELGGEEGVEKKQREENDVAVRVKLEGSEESSKVVVEDVVTVSANRSSINSPAVSSALPFSHLSVEWRASPLVDTIADSAVGILLQLFSTTSQLRLHQFAATTSMGHAHGTRKAAIGKKRKPIIS
eukprot:CAMPEP_0170083002 /NCGR_PEP_ID=MMETSP0019_2-20121128/18424_1 /TAXON_ID=98059 /ORGANISM="Dinobryon sp., Strain UTEXLB2267" /LENGTH=679 /DNA_ID=CAMNT_0010298105 /DNA_START=38 /DNA_END=2077 /DNA_ORIENTATION=+